MSVQRSNVQGSKGPDPWTLGPLDLWTLGPSTPRRDRLQRQGEPIHVGRRVVEGGRRAHAVALREPGAPKREQTVAIEQLRRERLVIRAARPAVQAEGRDARDQVSIVRRQHVDAWNAAHGVYPAVTQVP